MAAKKKTAKKKAAKKAPKRARPFRDLPVGMLPSRLPDNLGNRLTSIACRLMDFLSQSNIDAEEYEIIDTIYGQVEQLAAEADGVR